jgi:NADH dehydrogenase
LLEGLPREKEFSALADDSGNRGRTRPHIVILGGGFAGLNAAHALRRVDADITLLDKHNYHTFQPLLYQVSTAYLPPEAVGSALRAVFRRQSNLTVRVGELTEVDWAK